MDQIILLVANYLWINVSQDEIIVALKNKGFSDQEIYLAYKAGKILYDSRIEMYGSPDPFAQENIDND